MSGTVQQAKVVSSLGTEKELKSTGTNKVVRGEADLRDGRF